MKWMERKEGNTKTKKELERKKERKKERQSKQNKSEKLNMKNKNRKIWTGNRQIKRNVKKHGKNSQQIKK